MNWEFVWIARFFLRIMRMEDDPLFAPMLSLTMSLSRILSENQA